MSELLATNPDIPEVDDLTPPAKAWVNSADTACKAFVGINEEGDKIFTTWKRIPGTVEDEIVNFGLYMDDTFERTDENTYTRIEDDIVTVIAKMENGKFISCEFIFGDWLIQYEPDMAGLAGTYAPSSAPSQSPTETTPEQTVF